MMNLSDTTFFFAQIGDLFGYAQFMIMACISFIVTLAYSLADYNSFTAYAPGLL